MITDILYAVLFWFFAIAATYLLSEVAEAGSWLLWVAQ